MTSVLRPVSPGWLGSRWQRLNGPARLQGVDLARGLAVIGMFAAHLLWTGTLVWTDPGTWIALVDGRSSILFATLAGVSIGLISGGSRLVRPLGRLRARLAIRAGLIWLIGIILAALDVPVYVILPAYGILFLLVLPFLSVPPRILLLVAVGIAIAIPFVQVLLDDQSWWSTPTGEVAATLTGWHYPFPVWLAFVLAGVAVSREDLRAFRTQIAMLVGGALVATGAYALDRLDPPLPGRLWDEVWTAEPHSSGMLEATGSGGFALAAIGVCLLLGRSPLTWLLLPLRAVGSMPLTAYTIQLLVWAGVAQWALASPGDLAGFRNLEPFLPLTIGVVALCTVWALVVGRGPMEWMIETLSRRIVRTSARPKASWTGAQGTPVPSPPQPEDG